MRRKNSYKNLNRKTFVTIFLQKPPISRQSAESTSKCNITK